MDITQMRYFLKTAETLNYTRAANQLYISRQALRQALSSMESELSVSLFINQKNKLALTAEGAYLKDACAQLVHSYDEMIGKLQNLSREEISFTLAFSQSLFPFIAPDWEGFACQFQKQYPSANLKIVHLSSDEILRALYANELTCGFLMQMPCKRPGFVMEPFVSYGVKITCRKKHPLLRINASEFTLKDLESYPCVGMGSLEETMHPLCQKCQEEGIHLQYEVIPECLDAFYRIEHSEAVGFDIVKEDIPDFSAPSGFPLSDYQWEIGLLYRENSPKLHDIRLLSHLMRAAYEQGTR